MTRLRRSRRGKTHVDVTTLRQDGLPRVRLSMGTTGTPNNRNTDMDEAEVEDLIVLLQFKLMMLRGEIPWEDD